MITRKMINDITAVIMITVIMMIVFTGPVCVFAGTKYTGNVNEYTLWRYDIEIETDHKRMNRMIPYHFEFTTDGYEKDSMEEVRVVPRGLNRIWWGTPTVGHCSDCKQYAEDPNLYSCRIFLENDQGREYITRWGVELTREDLLSTGIDFDNMTTPIRVGIELYQKPGTYCTACKQHVGDMITVDNLTMEYLVIDYASEPTSVSTVPGGKATFSVSTSIYRDIKGTQRSEYQWVVKDAGGNWVELSEGTASNGEVYSGTTTNHLEINNVSDKIQSRELACRLIGYKNNPVYTRSATLSIPGNTNPSSTDPPDEPIIPPVSPPPSPTAGPTDPSGGITPGGGGSSSYKPSTSTSSYVPGQTPSSGNRQTSSSSNTVIIPEGKGGGGGEGGSYTGSVSTGGNTALSNPGSTVSATDPSAKGSAGSGGSGASGKGKGTSSGKGSSSGSSSRSSMNSSGSGTSRSGSNYVMKNGVLYIIDDENSGPGTDGELDKDNDTEVEMTEKEQEYSAADLAVDGQLREQGRKSGFFNMPAGYAVIIAVSLLILLLLLFFLFFGVIVFGEVEEHDEVFELCAIRLMLRRDGNWYIRIGEAFDENAVLSLRLGLLFAIIFKEWELTAEVTGMYEGTITGQITQGMQLYRKNIRRSV